MAFVLFIIVLIGVAFALCGAQRRGERDGGWHPWQYQMRRFKDGRWEQRQMTDAEMSTAVSEEAW